VTDEHKRQDDWHGEERRSLPIHIINYIDERFRDHADQFNGKLDSVQQEVYHLSQSITSWMDKQEKSCDLCRNTTVTTCEKLIDEMVPTHPDNPDATPVEKRKEHRKAHASWIKKVEDEMDEWKLLRQRVREWALVGGLGVLALAVWQYLLNGPK
jgi:hypothetical protein